MLNAEQAAAVARDFFLSLPRDLLDRGSSPTLEEIKENAGTWHVVFSYLTDTSGKYHALDSLNEFARALQVRRQFRELLVNASSGTVEMRNPANA
jgi:hypothetical protein